MEKITYSELREKYGKSMILEWQKMCNYFGFDPDPTVTVAFEITPVIEDPSIQTPDKVGGPAGGPARPPFDAGKRDEARPDSAVVMPDDGHVSIGLDVDGDGKVDQVVTIARPTTKPEGDGNPDVVITSVEPNAEATDPVEGEV